MYLLYVGVRALGDDVTAFGAGAGGVAGEVVFTGGAGRSMACALAKGFVLVDANRYANTQQGHQYDPIIRPEVKVCPSCYDNNQQYRKYESRRSDDVELPATQLSAPDGSASTSAPHSEQLPVVLPVRS